jgi:hypothetical protein
MQNRIPLITPWFYITHRKTDFSIYIYPTQVKLQSFQHWLLVTGNKAFVNNNKRADMRALSQVA